MTTTELRPRDEYPTRVVSRPSITWRLDPVVWGAHPGPLDDEELERYERDGFLEVPDLLSAEEVGELEEAIARIASDTSRHGEPQRIVEPDSNALRSVFAVHTGDDALGRLTRDERLVGRARQVLASEVYVHQSRANLKPGFRGREFYWHSDFETWHAEDGMPRMRALSFSIALADNHPWNGPLLVIAGSHRWFVSCVGETPERHFERSLRKQEYGTPDDQSLAELHRRGRIEQCVGRAGSAVMFDCNAMHGSNGNISPLPRRNVFVVFNSVENRLVEPYAAPAPRPEHIATRSP